MTDATQAPDPVEACETPIADFLNARAQFVAEIRAALAGPARVTVTDWVRGVIAAREHRAEESQLFSGQWVWWCMAQQCEAGAKLATWEEANTAGAEHVVSQILAAARVEVTRG